ncbi:MAG: Gfo/Idh/MocA family oxidoreductase [Actinobacteria bacterium]|nr:Gfo/Idh/MocA family oxidoreductase [Actinomycetota bacterium]
MSGGGDTPAVRVGMVGLGYWGPNLARNFDALPGSMVAWLCDGNESALARHAHNHRQARTTTEFQDLLDDDSLDAVVIATNVPQHVPLAERALAAGKSAFVEKPLGATLEETERLVELAESSPGVLMVGHLLEYHPGVERLKALVEAGDLGEVRYVYSTRVNLGQLRTDENAMLSLGPHDVSVALSLIGETPASAWARGESYVHDGVEDVVFGYLRFPSGVAAHMHWSWLDPHKERRITVVGSERMATFDDMRVEGKLTVYDKGFDQSFESHSEYMARSGDIWQPRISNEEPLRIECRHFIDCVRTGETPRTDGRSGLQVVRVLEQLQRSLDESSASAGGVAGGGVGV